MSGSVEDPWSYTCDPLSGTELYEGRRPGSAATGGEREETIGFNPCPRKWVKQLAFLYKEWKCGTDPPSAHGLGFPLQEPLCSTYRGLLKTRPVPLGTVSGRLSGLV
ncbi:hypothetical protein Salat_0658500 [Sesamum alatum]|uniref:Uncharacterized protein n=1 Tax=Sesamum alatum TaxID=300844 RepID=A0AAE1YQU9_9LAMI|nr:hypothetical protein Salat_0658500 [Sesamum alatum]